MSGTAKLTIKVFDQPSPIRKDVTSVYWRYISGEPLTAFHCPYCTAIIFKFRGRIKYLVSGEPVSTEVLRLQCPNKNCQMQYPWVEYELMDAVASNKY